MNFLTKFKRTISKTTAAVISAGAISQPALAAGFSTAKTLLTTIESGLEGLAIIVITIATLWVGYKILWNSQSLKDCNNIIIGGIIIASASELGSLLAGAYA